MLAFGRVRVGSVYLIDNYDSFTYNVARYIRELAVDVIVVKNDELSLRELAACKPSAVVISPGPCTPAQAGISLDAINHLKADVPILGICLGHQAIGEAFGAMLMRAQRPMHGKVSVLSHASEGLFVGLPSTFQVARYHSLLLDKVSLPAELRIDAWSSDDATEVMAISHRTLPVHGLQFHPEAVLSEHGHALLERFLTLYKLV